jgi:hypothetical protein
MPLIHQEKMGLHNLKYVALVRCKKSMKSKTCKARLYIIYVEYD